MPDNRRTWYLDRSINLPTVLTITAMLCGAFLYIAKQNDRQTAAEGRITATESSVKELKGDLREDVRRVENKLDQLIMGDRKRP